MIDGIYNPGVLVLAGNIMPARRLAAPDATATVHAKLCGSMVRVDLRVEDGTVVEYAQDVEACALGTAAAAVMEKTILGRSASELRALRETMWKMLKENGPPPGAPFGELAVLEPVRDYKARHASTLLVFDAVVEALDKIAARAVAEPA